MTNKELFNEYVIKFKEWLDTAKKQKKHSAGSRVSNIKVIGEYYDVLKEFTIDECEGIMEELKYSKSDTEPKTNIVIEGDYYNGLATYRAALKLFVQFLKEENYVAPAAPKVTSAKFIGSFDEFKRYVGAKCKNEVNIFCKTEREKHKGICEYCQNKDVLQSAHIKERPIIIKEILDEYYSIGEDLYEVALEEFFTYFKEAHMPVPDHIFFLCSKCHDNLDKYHKISIDDIKRKRA